MSFTSDDNDLNEISVYWTAYSLANNFIHFIVENCALAVVDP